MVKFFQDHWQMILIGLIGVAVGVLLNMWLRDYENKKLLELLVKELTTIQEKEKISVLTPEEQKKKQRLESEIYILKFKCK